MNIGQLLAAGRSFAGQKDRVGRYRQVNPKSIPKFDAGGSPRRQVSAGSSSAEAEARENQAQSAQPQPAVKVHEPVARPKGALSLGPICRADLPRKPTFWARLLSLVWPAKRREGLQKGSTASKRPIQVELRLEQVKVVRNDLSDTDLELVPSKPKPREVPPESKDPPSLRQTAAKSARAGMVSILRVLS